MLASCSCDCKIIPRKLSTESYRLWQHDGSCFSWSTDGESALGSTRTAIKIAFRVEAIFAESYWLRIDIGKRSGAEKNRTYFLIDCCEALLLTAQLVYHLRHSNDIASSIFDRHA